MVVERLCESLSNAGRRCRASTLPDSAFCLFHDPDHVEAVAEGRRLGGLRRRREGTLAASYDFAGLATVRELRRLLEIATLDTLNLENSVARNRTLIASIQTGSRLLEVGELEERLAAIEAALGPRVLRTASRARR
jgi:hypothetical protein